MLSRFRLVCHKIYVALVLQRDLLFGKSSNSIPPKAISDVGTSDFEETGKEFLKYFIELCGLKQDSKVLDVGCGIGRMAIPLTKYLSSNGQYEGFDIVPHEIKWCRKKISPFYPNFNFSLADVFNVRYNPNGKYKAADYQFPFEDDYFDFVFLTSVFTHMLTKDMQNYLSEITRVIKKRGKCLITFLLLNDDSIKEISNGNSTINLRHEYGEYRVLDPEVPEAIVAYDEKFIIDMFNNSKLKIEYPILYGSWCGRKEFISYQDIIIAAK